MPPFARASSPLVMPLALAATLALAAPALAQSSEEPGRADRTAREGKADSPEKAVLLLKAAWEGKDDAAVVARHAEPGASTLKRDLASRRRLEAAAAAVLRAAKDRLEGAGAVDLGLDGLEARDGGRPLAWLALGTVSVSQVRIDGEKATARVRVESLDWVREQRVSFVQRSGDWKLVLADVDGAPLDDGGLARLLARAELRERVAADLDAVAKDVASGALASRAATRSRVATAVEKERVGLAKLADEAARAKRGTKPASPPNDGRGDDGQDDGDDE